MKKINSCFVWLFILVLILVACSKKTGHEEKKIRSQNTSGGIVFSESSSSDRYSFSEEEYVGNLLSYRKPIDEVREQYEADCEKLRNLEQSNYKFGNCDFKEMKDFTGVTVLKSDEESESISIEDSLDIFRKELKRTGRDKEIKLEDYVIETINHDIKEEECVGEFGDAELGWYPLVFKHLDKIKSGSNFAIVDTKNFHLQMVSTGILSFSDGKINEYTGYSMRDAFHEMLTGDYAELVSKPGESLNDYKDMSYELLDGKISVSDAADMTRNFFVNESPLLPSENVDVEICDFELYKVKDSFMYRFWLRRKYEGVPFAYHIKMGRKRYNDVQFRTDYKFAMTITGKEVNYYYGPPEHQKFEPLIERQTKVLSLEDAFHELEAKMGENLKCNISKVEFVYAQTHREFFKDKNNDLLPEQIINIVYPCWEFTGYSMGDKLFCYVDALTGDVYYYVEVN